MPSLKSVSMLLSTATPAMIDAFAKANPQANFIRSMNGELSARLATADRMIARTGGICHRRPDHEKTIAEIKDHGEITELARHFEVAESESGGHCMCCGDPTFEFYHGDTKVAMIGFHHARSIRWADGVWPGDGMLTSLSAEHLVEWLAKHGYTKPRDDVREGRRQQVAAQRRYDRYKALLPAGLEDALNGSQSLEEATAAMEKAVPDAAARARLFLQLFGCDDATWALSSGYDQALQQAWLPSIPAATLHAAIRDAREKTEEGQGAARWVFGNEHAYDWKEEPEHLERMARFALTHPRQGNRWRTLSVLRDLGTPKAVEILRDVMKRGSAPRKLGADEEYEPGGQMTFFPNAISLPDGTADSVAAAFCLATLKDEPSASEVARIHDALSKEAREKWDKNLSR